MEAPSCGQPMELACDQFAEVSADKLMELDSEQLMNFSPDESVDLDDVLQSLGLNLDVHARAFAQMESTNDAFIHDLINDAKKPEQTMTTEEFFGVDTEDCSSSRIECDRDTTVDDMVDEPEKSCAPDLDDDMEDMQDLYGGRNYGLPSSRPTMISAKYRQKEERRKVMKLSVQKLSRIDDPESSLRRSVLINNTVKRLHRESCEEKSPSKHHRDQVSKSRSQSKCFGISNDFITKQQEQNLKVEVFATSLGGRAGDQLLDITNRPDGKTCVSKCDAADCLDCDEAISDLVFPGDHHHHHQRSSNHVKMSRKRSLDETTLEEECDVLSPFYMPPTPRTIPSLEDDEDEDVNVVDIDTTPVEPPAKRKREDCCETSLADAVNCCLTAADRLRDNLPSFSSSSTVSSSCTTSSATSTSSSTSTTAPTSPSLPLFDDWIDESILLSTTSGIQATSHAAPSSNYSCGHSSMLGEIVVYHNLIASFES